MKEPKTIKGYIKLIRNIEKIAVSTLKGYDNLNQEQKNILSEISGQISNNINEYNDENNPRNIHR